MKKLVGLKTLLLAAVPALKANPELLSLYTDKGTINAIGTPSLSFELAYTVTIWIQDFAGDTDTLFVPILSWIAGNQPDLFARGDPFSFETEILDADTSDVSITIALTERVVVERKANRTLRTTHLDDAPLFDGFAGVPSAVTLWRGLVDDQGASDGVATP